MLWADGHRHDWKPGAPGCPYSPLSIFLDEFLSAARHGLYGTEIMDLAEQVSVKGRKYGIGEHVAGQSIYVQDGFTQLLNENLRDNSIPMILRVAAKKVPDMFKALGIAPDDIPEPLPRTFTAAEQGRIERIMAGEPEPPADSNTGGVGWIVEARKPEVLRTLFMDFDQDIAPLFPDEITTLTDHEIAELEARGLWFDWTLPPQPGEFGPAPDDEDDEGGDGAGEFTDGGRHRGGGYTPTTSPGSAALTTTRDALEAIKKLTGGSSSSTQPARDSDGHQAAGSAPDDLPDLVVMAAELVISTQFGSTSMLQRKLRIGSDLVDQVMGQLEAHGVVGPTNGDKARAVLIRTEDADQALTGLKQALHTPAAEPRTPLTVF
jgi:hypothetical protein